jgi:hypothetical protein
MPKRNTVRRLKDSASRHPSTATTQKTAPLGTPAEPWHRALRAWRSPTDKGRPDFYYQWLPSDGSCARSAVHGCFKLKVVSRQRCPRGVVVIATEMRHGADVGIAEGFSTKSVLARVRTVVELDTDRGYVTPGQISSMICHGT